MQVYGYWHITDSLTIETGTCGCFTFEAKLRRVGRMRPRYCGRCWAMNPMPLMITMEMLPGRLGSPGILIMLTSCCTVLSASLATWQNSCPQTPEFYMQQFMSESLIYEGLYVRLHHN